MPEAGITLLMFNLTWEGVPSVNHSDAKEWPPGLTSSLLSHYVEGVAGVPGDPAGVMAHQREPSWPVHCIKPTNDFEGLNLVI